MLVKVWGHSNFFVSCLNRTALTLNCLWFTFVFFSLNGHRWCCLGIFTFSFRYDLELWVFFFIDRDWWCEGGKPVVIFGTLLDFSVVIRAGLKMPGKLNNFMWTYARLAMVPLSKWVRWEGFLFPTATVFHKYFLRLFEVPYLRTSGYCLCRIHKSSGNSKIFFGYFVRVTKLDILRHWFNRFGKKA